MATPLIRRAAHLVAIPWRNGLGTTRDVVTVLAPDGALHWQVSIADLEQDAPFSHFPHCDRVFTPIAGDPPPELAVAGGPFEPCPLLVPRRFPGEVPTLSRIPAPGRAFNAIADRRVATLAVAVLTLEPGAPVPIDPATVVAYCHAGALAWQTDRLAPGDSLLPGPGDAPLRATAPSQVILVALHPL